MPIVSVMTDIHTRIYNLVGYTSPLRWRAKAYQIKATLADELASAAGTAAPYRKMIVVPPPFTPK